MIGRVSLPNSVTLCLFLLGSCGCPFVYKRYLTMRSVAIPAVLALVGFVDLAAAGRRCAPSFGTSSSTTPGTPSSTPTGTPLPAATPSSSQTTSPTSSHTTTAAPSVVTNVVIGGNFQAPDPAYRRDIHGFNSEGNCRLVTGHGYQKDGSTESGCLIVDSDETVTLSKRQTTTDWNAMVEQLLDSLNTANLYTVRFFYAILENDVADTCRIDAYYGDTIFASTPYFPVTPAVDNNFDWLEFVEQIAVETSSGYLRFALNCAEGGHAQIYIDQVFMSDQVTPANVDTISLLYISEAAGATSGLVSLSSTILGTTSGSVSTTATTQVGSSSTSHFPTSISSSQSTQQGTSQSSTSTTATTTTTSSAATSTNYCPPGVSPGTCQVSTASTDDGTVCSAIGYISGMPYGASDSELSQDSPEHCAWLCRSQSNCVAFGFSESQTICYYVTRSLSEYFVPLASSDTTWWDLTCMSCCDEDGLPAPTTTTASASTSQPTTGTPVSQAIYTTPSTGTPTSTTGSSSTVTCDPANGEGCSLKVLADAGLICNVAGDITQEAEGVPTSEFPFQGSAEQCAAVCRQIAGCAASSYLSSEGMCQFLGGSLTRAGFTASSGGDVWSDIDCWDCTNCNDGTTDDTTSSNDTPYSTGISSTGTPSADSPSTSIASTGTTSSTGTPSAIATPPLTATPSTSTQALSTTTTSAVCTSTGYALSVNPDASYVCNALGLYAYAYEADRTAFPNQKTSADCAYICSQIRDCKASTYRSQYDKCEFSDQYLTSDVFTSYTDGSYWSEQRCWDTQACLDGISTTTTTTSAASTTTSCSETGYATLSVVDSDAVCAARGYYLYAYGADPTAFPNQKSSEDCAYICSQIRTCKASTYRTQYDTCEFSDEYLTSTVFSSSATGPYWYEQRCWDAHACLDGKTTSTTTTTSKATTCTSTGYATVTAVESDWVCDSLGLYSYAYEADRTSFPNQATSADCAYICSQIRTCKASTYRSQYDKCEFSDQYLTSDVFYYWATGSYWYEQRCWDANACLDSNSGGQKRSISLEDVLLSTTLETSIRPTSTGI